MGIRSILQASEFGEVVSHREKTTKGTHSFYAPGQVMGFPGFSYVREEGKGSWFTTWPQG